MNRKAISFTLAFIVAAGAGAGCLADDRGTLGVYIPGEYEEIYGSWVNDDYADIPYPRNAGYPQKVVFHRWGYCEYFVKLGDKIPFKGTSAIVAKRKDPEGNCWYRTYDRDPDARRAYLYLYKIDAANAVLESVWSYTDFPSEDDLNSKNQDFYYRVYYRR